MTAVLLSLLSSKHLQNCRKIQLKQYICVFDYIPDCMKDKMPQVFTADMQMWNATRSGQTNGTLALLSIISDPPTGKEPRKKQSDKETDREDKGRQK